MINCDLWHKSINNIAIEHNALKTPLEKVIAIANQEYNTDLKKSCYQVIYELKGTRKHYSIDNLCTVFN